MNPYYFCDPLPFPLKPPILVVFFLLSNVGTIAMKFGTDIDGKGRKGES